MSTASVALITDSIYDSSLSDESKLSFGKSKGENYLQ